MSESDRESERGGERAIRDLIGLERGDKIRKCVLYIDYKRRMRQYQADGHSEDHIQDEQCTSMHQTYIESVRSFILLPRPMPYAGR